MFPELAQCPNIDLNLPCIIVCMGKERRKNWPSYDEPKKPQAGPPMLQPLLHNAGYVREGKGSPLRMLREKGLPPSSSKENTCN